MTEPNRLREIQRLNLRTDRSIGFVIIGTLLFFVLAIALGLFLQ